MRILSTILIFLLTSNSLISQNSIDTSCLNRIVDRSSSAEFERFDGQIVQRRDTFEFDFASIKLTDTNPISTLILKSGLIHPRLILSASTDGQYSFKAVDRRVIALLHISSIDQLNVASSDGQTKVFSLLLWYGGLANPSRYLFQLTNKSCNPKSDMQTYIKGARLTAFGFCTIQI